MNRLKNITVLILCAIPIWCSYQVISLFWDRYWVKLQMETAAIYGTRNSIDKARDILVGKLAEKGFDFSGDDFVIEKDENHTVTINLGYIDEVSVLGVCLKELEFNVEATAHRTYTY